MAIIVKPIDELFKIVLEVGEEKVELFIKQLDYKTKSYITGLVTSVSQGQVTVDSTLTLFYNIKYGLKKVTGMENLDGEPYKLEFETPQKECLTDKCTDELLAAPFSDNLQWTARELSKASYPSEVIHPLTGKPIEGIQVVSAQEMKGTKKKS
jgi:hypothetical protein